VCGRAAGNTPRTQKQTEWNETRNCKNSIVALQDHSSFMTFKHKHKRLSANYQQLNQNVGAFLSVGKVTFCSGQLLFGQLV